MTREEAIQVLQTALTAPFIYGEYAEAINMAIEALQVKTEGDPISRQGAIDCVRWGDSVTNVIDKINALPSAEPKTGDKNELKFYYVESLDDYWVGRRLDNFYYATWNGRLGFIWSHSKYLPWGQHIVDENTAWKEHTYPSEPIEIPFTEWIVGFVNKYSADRSTGRWVDNTNGTYTCDRCGCKHSRSNFCPNCGAKMEGGEDK